MVLFLNLRSSWPQGWGNNRVLSSFDKPHQFNPWKVGQCRTYLSILLRAADRIEQNVGEGKQEAECNYQPQLVLSLLRINFESKWKLSLLLDATDTTPARVLKHRAVSSGKEVDRLPTLPLQGIRASLVWEKIVNIPINYSTGFSVWLEYTVIPQKVLCECVLFACGQAILS